MNIHPILNCAPQAPYGKVDETWVLIPALAWQVIIVESAIDRLDAFEKVIYDLMRSGDYSVEQLASFTHLHPDLVMILLEGLHGYGLLDKADDSRYRAFPSKTDAKAAAENSGTQTVGWVFQQPWTGRLFPAFFPRLPVQPTSENGRSSGMKKLLFGDEANPLVRTAPALNFPQQRGINPTARDVIRLFELRRSAEFQERLSALRRIPFKDSSSQEFDYKKSVRKVKFLSPEPVSVSLATAGLVFDDSSNDWHVCCPVGTGLSQELRDQILRCSEAGDSGAIAVVNRLCEKTKLGNIYEWRQAQQDFLQHARKETLSTFGPTIQEYPELLDQLDAFHDVWVRLRGTEGIAPRHFVEFVCSAARKTIEALVKVHANLRPITNLGVTLVSKNEDENTRSVLEWLSQTGYATAGIDGLFIVSRNWLTKSAGDSGNYFSLKYVIGAIALQGKEQEDHPLRISVKNNRDFFIQLKQVLELGNSSSHDNSHKSGHNDRLTKDVALSIREPLIRIIRSLIDPDGTIFKQD
jgi:hypothetical protein